MIHRQSNVWVPSKRNHIFDICSMHAYVYRGIFSWKRYTDESTSSTIIIMLYPKIILFSSIPNKKNTRSTEQLRLRSAYFTINHSVRIISTSHPIGARRQTPQVLFVGTRFSVSRKCIICGRVCFVHYLNLKLFIYDFFTNVHILFLLSI